MRARNLSCEQQLWTLRLGRPALWRIRFLNASDEPMAMFESNMAIAR